MGEQPLLAHLEAFFARPVCQRATEPLKPGARIAISIGDCLEVTLVRTRQSLELLEGHEPPADLSFRVSEAGLRTIVSESSEDIGELGISILKQMAHPDPADRLIAQVHMGPSDMFFKGYLGVLPLGGPGVLKFLASRGYTGISQIRKGIARFR